MSAPPNAIQVASESAAASAGTSSARRLRGNLLGQVGFYAFIALFVIFCLAPFVWTLLTSFKGPTTIFDVPIRYLPRPAELTNYRQIFQLDRFRWALLNSVIVASSATAISLTIGSICAYAVARLNFPGKNFLLAMVLAIAMFPGIAIIGPLFRQFNAWGLTNNVSSNRDLYAEELEESARVDGCTRMQTFYKIVAPLAAPGVFTAAILLFIQAWNEFLFARTFMSDPHRLTATVAIAQFEGADVATQYPWGQITAASIVITLPLVVLVLLFQRRIISGLTAGAVKG